MGEGREEGELGGGGRWEMREKEKRWEGRSGKRGGAREGDGGEEEEGRYNEGGEVRVEGGLDKGWRERGEIGGKGREGGGSKGREGRRGSYLGQLSPLDPDINQSTQVSSLMTPLH